jgi:uncharacterized repeat protein (TIGR01451 family)
MLIGALVLAGAPLLAPAPASALVPTVPGVGCVVNAAQTVTSNTVVSIPDTNFPIPGFPMASATSTIPVAAGGALEWIRVRTDITHTNPADLLVTLTSPLGDVLTLTSGNGGGNDDVFDGTWWDDDAGETAGPGSAAEATYANGVTQTPLAPEAALANLRGQDVAGNWVLTVTDRVLGGGSGSIQGWAIEYATRSGAAPDTHAVASGPLPGGTVPAGQSRSFTYTSSMPGPGNVDGVAAGLDIAGQAGSVLATLTSPAGNVVTLTNGNGGLLSSFLGGTRFDDLGGLTTGPIADLVTLLLGHIPLAAPQEPLSSLVGEGTAGPWTLDVTNLGGLPLTLNDWDLGLTSSTCGLDGALTPLTQLPASLPLGSTFTYAVAATNNRLASLTGSQLGMVLPKGLELVSVTSTLGSCAGLTCLLGTLLPGAEAIVVYVLKVVGDGVQDITLSLSSLGGDAVPANNVLKTSSTVTPSTTPAKDTTAPSLVLMLGKDKLRTVAGKGVLSAAGWTEGGRLTLTIKLPGKVAKRLHLPRVIGKKVMTTTKAGTAKLRLHVSKKAAAKLLKSEKQVRLVLKGRLKDPAGNVGKASAGATYKP